MGEAWMNKNISPHEFRKCLTSDLEFCKEFERIVNEKMKAKQEEIDQEKRVIEAMRNL